MTLTFMDYEVTDEGITLHFVSPDPGPGQASDKYLVLTDAELAGVTTLAALRDLVLTKAKRKLLAEGIATKLNGFIGQSVTL